MCAVLNYRAESNILIAEEFTQSGLLPFDERRHDRHTIYEIAQVKASCEVYLPVLCNHAEGYLRSDSHLKT